MTNRLRRARPLLAILPALAFLAFLYFVPVVQFLAQGFMRDNVGNILSHTSTALSTEKLKTAPSEAAYRALFDDFAAAPRSEIGKLARNIASVDERYLGVILRTTGEVKRLGNQPENAREWFVAINPLWNDPEIWRALNAQTTRFTWQYIVTTSPWSTTSSSEEFDYPRLFARTVLVGLAVALLCLFVAAPIAHLLNTASTRIRFLIFSCVLLSLWTSILARTLSWIVIFQREGVLNLLAQTMSLINEPLEILGTRTAVVVGMVHILLPYMIFSLYDGMRKVPPEQMRAALSLGAAPVRAILRVYIPQLWPAVSSGLVMVFTLTVGFYLTPLLLGGPADQLIGYYTSFMAQHTGNWHSAAALSVWLIVIVAVAGLFAWMIARVSGRALRGTRA